MLFIQHVSCHRKVMNMPQVLGYIIVIAALAALVAVCLKQIIGEIRGGGCAGCSGGCASCSTGCSKGSCGIDKSKASDILNKIEKPRKLK